MTWAPDEYEGTENKEDGLSAGLSCTSTARDTCCQCGEKINPFDDDAGVCIECGGMNARIKKRFLDKLLSLFT